MTAVVRIKRRRDEPAADSIVLFCKKQKLDGEPDESSDKVETVFKFAATVPTNGSVVSKCVTDAISKEKLEKEYKRHDPGLYRERVKATSQKQAMQGRYNIVSRRRGVDLTMLNDSSQINSGAGYAESEVKPSATSDSADKKRKAYCLFDVEIENSSTTKVSKPQDEDVISCNGVPMIREKVVQTSAAAESKSDADNYVYDVYYMNNSQFDFRTLENILLIEAYQEKFVYEGGGYDDDDVYDDDDDDENAENNWRNDYPDEDPHHIDAPPRSSVRYLEYDDGLLAAAFSDDEEYADNDDLDRNFRNRLKVSDDSDEEHCKERTPQYYIDMFKRLRDD